MATVQLNTNDGGTYTRPLPWAPNNSVSVSGGFVSVNAEDVDQCVRQLGWTVMAGQVWEPLQRMRVPVAGNWPSSGTVTLPDGTTAAVSSGIALIPKPFATWAANFGFQPV